MIFSSISWRSESRRAAFAALLDLGFICFSEVAQFDRDMLADATNERFFGPVTPPHPINASFDANDDCVPPAVGLAVVFELGGENLLARLLRRGVSSFGAGGSFAACWPLAPTLAEDGAPRSLTLRHHFVMWVEMRLIMFSEMAIVSI
jgi:hypothetical protein